MTLGETIRRRRMEKKLSQQQFADMLFVDRSTCANWETGRRMPDAAMLSRISECLNIDVAYLINVAKHNNDFTHVIMVDDERIVLTGGLPVIEKVLPNVKVTGFTKPSEAIDFVKNNYVSLAFLDIEMGKKSGLDLCRELLEINSSLNVIFLTAYADYSFDAWDTGACGFLLKPLSEESVRKQLNKLHYPFLGSNNT